MFKTQNQYFLRVTQPVKIKKNSDDKDRIINDSKLRISIKLKFMKLHVSANVLKKHIQAVRYKGKLHLCYVLSAWHLNNNDTKTRQVVTHAA
jgi:hypothetical protein